MSPTHVVIEYGKPIIPSELDRDTQRHLGAYTQNIIKEMLIKNKELVGSMNHISFSRFRWLFFIYFSGTSVPPPDCWDSIYIFFSNIF